jgi:hypothetical protein
MDIATGTDGNIYVLDAYNRINVFKKKTFKESLSIKQFCPKINN